MIRKKQSENHARSRFEHTRQCINVAKMTDEAGFVMRGVSKMEFVDVLQADDGFSWDCLVKARLDSLHH